MRSAWLFLVGLICLPYLRAAGVMEVYVVDVEGGKSMLVVSPSGQAVLVDGGWGGFNNEKYVMIRPNGRDAARIAAVVKLAGVKQIDYFVVTHYDTDHIGGVPAAVAAIGVPVLHFADHGEPLAQDQVTQDEFRAYLDAVGKAKAQRIVVKPGDKLPIEGIEITVLTAAAKTLAAPLPGAGAANPPCANLGAAPPARGENPASVGLRYIFGAFRMVDLGDATKSVEYGLMCPNNLVGAADLLIVSHHGNDVSNSPQLIHALHPRAAILNNSYTKFGRPDAFRALRTSPGLEDLWQLHYAAEAGEGNNAPENLVANPQTAPDPASYGSVLGDQAHWIKVTARSDGSFTVLNSRNQYSKTYAAPK
jgi:competence protein ComEC